MQVQILQKTDVSNLFSIGSAKTTIREKERQIICMYVCVHLEGEKGKREKHVNNYESR